jgi:hypothetical protein
LLKSHKVKHKDHPLKLSVDLLQLPDHPLQLSVDLLQLSVDLLQLSVDLLQLPDHPLKLSVDPLQLPDHPAIDTKLRLIQSHFLYFLILKLIFLKFTEVDLSIITLS